MRQPKDVNPYALGGHTADPSLAAVEGVGGEVSSTALCLWSMGACTVAGCLFGLVSVAIVLAASLIANDDPATRAPLTDFVLFAGSGIVLGGILSLVFSVPSVMLIFIGGMPWRNSDHRWDSNAIGRFAAVSGLLAGFLPFTVLSGFELSVVLFSILPAVFGCFVARLLIIPLARKARPQPEPLSSQPLGNYAGD